MISEVIERICPATIMLNVGAIGLSMTNLEVGLKIASYLIAIIWTALKITKEIRDWKAKKNG